MAIAEAGYESGLTCLAIEFRDLFVPGGKSAWRSFPASVAVLVLVSISWGSESEIERFEVGGCLDPVGIFVTYREGLATPERYQEGRAGTVAWRDIRLA